MLLAIALSTLLALALDPMTEAEEAREVAVDGMDVEGPELWGELVPGPYSVGLRIDDVVPSDEDLGPEPFGKGYRVFVWYPAGPSDADVLTWSDYYRAQEESAPSDDEVVAWLIDDVNAVDGELDGELGAELASAPLAARRDAPAAEGRFPLALWSARHAVPSSQTAMVEYLASHGVVVAYAWPLGTTPPMPWEDHEPGVAIDTLEMSLEMLGGALEHCNGLRFVDSARTAVLGWSYGGESATLFAHRHDTIDLVVSLSSNAVSGWAFRNDVALANLDASKLAMPYLVLSQASGRAGDAPSGRPGFLQRMAGDSVYVEFARIHHGDFRFDSGLTLGRLGLPPTPWSAGGEASASGYVTAARIVKFALTHLDDPLSVEGEVARLAADLPADFLRATRTVKAH